MTAIDWTGAVALVTGASRQQGLGFELCRQLAQKGLVVILTARDATRAEANARALKEGGAGDVRGEALDIESDASVTALAARLDRAFGRLDVLINNASGSFDAGAPTIGADLDDVRRKLETTLIGPWRLISAVAPLLLKSEHPRIVSLSSEGASFAAAHGMAKRGKTLGAYAVSKAAQNALTVKMAAAFEGTRVKVNAADPGWIATYPGTAEQGARPVAQGAAGVVLAATLPDDGPTGKFLHDGRELPW
jgi:NAD(P)-dependent dehydrogenase (short-subunit alcohol dehydrogenase family)